MIRVLLVDDEPVILRSLEKLIHSTDSGFRVIATAGNGKEGLRLLEEVAPDVAIVDISMPVMDGLEMIRALRQSGLDTQIAILSGFGDFEYARQAMPLDVTEYLVKPIDPRTFPNFLENMRQVIEKKRKNRLAHHIRNALFDIDHHASSSAERGMASEFYLAKLCFGAYSLRRGSAIERQVPVPPLQAVLNTVRGYFSAEQSPWVFRDLLVNEFVFVVEAPVADMRARLRQSGNSVMAQFPQAGYISICYSQTPVLPEDFPRRLQQIDTELFHSALFGKSSITCLEERSEDRQDNDSQLNMHASKFAAIPASASIELKRQMLESVLAHEAKTGLTQQQLFRLLEQVVSIMSCTFDRQESSEMIDQVLTASVDIPTLMNQCTVLFEYCHEKAVREDANNAEFQVLSVRDYIDEHFREPLRVQNLADRFGISYSYLSALFRRHFRFSPSEYIIKKRMELAKELLMRDPNLGIRDVAFSAGYDDAYYFSRLFRSHVGCSPTEYKTQRAQ